METAPPRVDPPGVAALTVSESGVWGNGRALRAVPLADGRTAVVTTIGVYLVDGSEVTAVDRFTTSTLVSSVAASADATKLAVATVEPPQLTWYDLQSGEVAVRQELAPSFLVRNIVFGADASLWVQTNGLLTSVRMGEAPGELNDSVGTGLSAPAISAVDGAAWSALVGTDQVVTVGVDGDTRIDTIDDLGEDVVMGTRMSPSGTTVAVFAEPEFGFDEVPKRAVVFDASSFAPLAVLTLAPTANSQAWTMSDTHLAVATGSDVELHSVDSGEMTLLRGATESSVEGVFVVEDAVVAVHDDGTIVRWSSDGETVETLAGPSGGTLENASVAADGSRLVAVDRSGVITTVPLVGADAGGASPDPVRLEDFAVGVVTTIDIDAESARIAGSTARGEVVVLDPSLSVQSRFSVGNGRVGAVAFVPGSSAVITGLEERIGAIAFDDTVAAWDPETGQASFNIGGESEDVVGCSTFLNRVEFLRDGAVMATTSHDYTVGLADTTTGEELFRFEPEIGTLLDLAATPDGSTLVVSSSFGTYTVWNMADRAKIATVQAPLGGYQAVATLPDNRTMATTSLDGVLGLVDIESGEQLVELDKIGYRGANPAEAIAVSVDGSLLATPTSDGAVGIWSTASGERLTTLVGHASTVTDVEIAPDMTFVVTSSSDGTIRTWTLETTTG